MKKSPPHRPEPSAYVAAEIGALKAMRRPKPEKPKAQQDEEKTKPDTLLPKPSTDT